MTTRRGARSGNQRPVEHLLLQDHLWAWRVALALWGMAGLLFVAMAIGPARSAIDALDRDFYDAVYAFKWGPLTVLAQTLAFLGSSIFLWPFRIGVAALLAYKRSRPQLWVWIISIGLSEPFIGILKALYDRPRPPVGLVTAASGSFPSGHAIAGSVTAVALVLIFVSAGPARRNLEMLAVLFSFLMAGSRLYLGAHWLTDVAAGVAFGTACAVGAAALVQRAIHTRGDVAVEGGGSASSAPSP